MLQRLCLTDYNAYASSAPVRSVSRVMPLVMNNQQQQQAGAAAGAANAGAGNQQQPAGAAAAGGPPGAVMGPFGIVSEVVTTITPHQQNQNRPEVDWTPLASLRCLMQLALKSSASHVLAAAQQLGQQQHTVKILKLEAQGLKVTELQDVAEQLTALPYLTWLALVLQYRPVRRPMRPIQQQRQAAAAGAGSSSNAQGGSDAAAAAAGAEASAAGAAAAAAGGAVPPGYPPGQWVSAAGVGGSAGWAWEPAEQLSRQLMQQLPGTALELKVRPHGWY
jgi:hypothetical protein